MSLYVEHKTVMTDPHCLVKVLEKRFKEVEYHHNNPQQLVGYQNDKRQQKAEIIIRKKYVGMASNDLGFARDASTGNFNAIVSDYDHGKYGTKWLEGISKEYLVEKATALMAEQESDLVEQESLPDGGIRLRYRVNAHA